MMKHGALRLKIISLLLLLLVFTAVCLPGPVSADPARQWVSLVTGADGSGNPIYAWVYGYYASAGGGTGNLFIQCDPATGNPIGEAYISGQQVGTKSEQEQVPVVTYQAQTHKLYAVEVFPDLLWKGDVGLLPYWAASNQLAVNCPFYTLPDNWTWMVYAFNNDNNWPVVADVTNCGLGSAGEALPSPMYEYFGAGQTKYLRLEINSNLNGQSVAHDFWTVANIHQNLDPLATPPFVTDPPAYDGTGVCWSGDDWEGLTFNSISNGEYVPYYTSQDFWALQPGFVQEPAWVPNPGEDPRWGTIQWNTVPGFVWVQQPGFSILGTGNSLIDASGMPGMPYIVGGGYGTFQTSKPSGPSAVAYSWNNESWRYNYVGYSGSPSNYYYYGWSNYVHQHWPNYQNIMGTDPSSFVLYNCYGYFYENPSQNQNIIYWSLENGYFSWNEYTPSTSSSGVNIGNLYSISPSSCPADGQQHWVFSNGISMQSATPGYVPISGSYDQVQSVTYNSGWSKNGYYSSMTGATFVQNLQVYNPGPGPVTFNLTGGLQNGDTYYCGYFSVPGASQGQVTIPPGQSVWLTSTYSLPQSSYWVYLGGFSDTSSSSVPASFFTPQYGSAYYQLASDFGTGATRPINTGWSGRVFTWTASGIENNCVGYDYGEYIADDTLLGAYSSNCSPGFYGSLLSYLRSMTSSEVTSFQGYYSVAAKAQPVLNGGHATWSATSHTQSQRYNGWYSYASAS
jgi:hypothetical protein